jgi:hypothetical protein
LITADFEDASRSHIIVSDGSQEISVATCEAAEVITQLIVLLVEVRYGLKGGSDVRSN